MSGHPIFCGYCGIDMVPNSRRYRLHWTPNGSVRTTRIAAHFHEECGDRMLAELRDRIAVAAAERFDRQWSRGPRFRLLDAAE
ncbi:MAG TPA: hypothetical protein VF628_02175 [Allosphingosinicella sp.]